MIDRRRELIAARLRVLADKILEVPGDPALHVYAIELTQLAAGLGALANEASLTRAMGARRN